MKNALEYLKIVESYDTRQQSKVLHKLSEIIGISFFAMIGYANDPGGDRDILQGARRFSA
jgi:hypothetical protein